MLLTKLHIPNPPKDTLNRIQLFSKLADGLNKKIILISAPAGYGKTILISDWIKQNNISAAWCSIDSRDNDPSEFLKLIIVAIQKRDSEIGKNSLELLNNPGTAKFEFIIELFINDLLQLDGEIVLVLDDLHLIENKPIFDILSMLIEYKPESLKLLISTRSDPPLPFARLRSQNEILELRSSDLSFKKNEILILFNKKLKLDLSENSIEILRNKTEGWIAGLQLSALSFTGQKDVAAYIEKMAGDNRYIMDYLMEEVLNNQSNELKEFFLHSSILERLSGPLCDAILLKNNSQQILETLEKENKFLIPLDNERKWFRYHHLFADLLKQRLSLQPKEKVTDLHIRASEWYENNEFSINAIEHAINAGDKERALFITNNIVDTLWETSQYGVIHRLGSYFSKEEILSIVNFCIVYSWILTVTGRVELAEEYLEILLKDKIDKRLLGRIYVTLNFVAVFKGNSEAAFRYSELATQNIADDDVLWGTWSFISYGEAHLLRFELNQSIRAFIKAKEKIENHSNSYLGLTAEAKLAYILMVQGKYREAYKMFKTLLDRQSNSSMQTNNITSSIIYSMIGLLEVLQNNVEKGILLAQKGYEMAQNATSISYRGYSTVLLAEACFLAGKLDESIEKIEELEEILLNHSAQWISVLAIVIKCRFFIFTGELEKAETLLQQKINTDKNYTFEKYFYAISKARLLVAQHKYNESMELLEELSKDFNADGAIDLLFYTEILKAKAYLLRKDTSKAKESVISALQITQSEICIRNYISEGEQIEGLLREIANEKKTRTSELLDSVSEEYLNKLLAAFDEERKSNKSKTDILTERELETLRLIAEELTNQEIADKLFVSLNTIKTRLKNIYLKLEVDNRRKAVEIAKSKGLL